jgi:hypothetical protein
LYSLASGDPGNGRYLSLAAVRWLTPPREIAAMVTDRGPNRLSAELYQFGKQSRSFDAEIYLLDPGDYEYTLEADAGSGNARPIPVRVTGPRTRVALVLPPGKLCTFRLTAAT